jgi:hypothetical protein
MDLKRNNSCERQLCSFSPDSVHCEHDTDKTFKLGKRRGISCLAERLSDSQEGLRPIEIVVSDNYNSLLNLSLFNSRLLVNLCSFGIRELVK